MYWNSTYVQNEIVQNLSRDLNRTEFTLSHQPFKVMSVISLNLPPDIQRCLKLNSSQVDGVSVGCNVVYRGFKIFIV
jgi:hypothetical protein